MTNPIGHTVVETTDALGRPVSSQDLSLGTTRSYTHSLDESGFLKTDVNDELARQHVIKRDGLGRLVDYSLISAPSRHVQVRYQGKNTTKTLPGGDVYSHTTDAKGRLKVDQPPGLDETRCP